MVAREGEGWKVRRGDLGIGSERGLNECGQIDKSNVTESYRGEERENERVERRVIERKAVRMDETVKKRDVENREFSWIEC